MREEKSADIQRLAEAGWRLMREGKPEKARQVFRQVLARLPGERPRARLRYRRGGSEIVVSRVGQDSQPLSPSESLGLDARLALANCCLECGLVEESIHHLERAVEVCPDRAEAYCELGLAYEKGGREGLAVSALRRALRLDPGLPRAYYSLAQHYVKRERLQEAKKALRKALRLSPERQEYYLGLAGCYVQQGRLEEALRWLRRAAKKFPGNAAVREMLAELYQRAGDYSGLMEQAQALVRLNPRNPHGYDLLAVAHFQRGDLEGAIESMSRLVSLDPLDALSRLKLGLLLQQNGELGRAMEEYQQVIALAPQRELVRAALEAMENLDHYQMQQILLRAAEDRAFRARLERDVEGTLVSHGYRLTEFAQEILRRLEFGSEPPSEQWEITYH